ncbi:MAG: hypothetical protein RL380_744 [Verrucomicrobiota bacterium]
MKAARNLPLTTRGFCVFVSGVKFPLLKLCLALAGLIGMVATAGAVTYKVGPTRTYKTLAIAAQKVNPGDVVEVDGDVSYAGNISFQRAGSSNAPIIIRGLTVNGHRPVISATVNTNAGVLIAFRGAHYVLENFDLDGATNANLLRGLYLAADDLTVRDVTVHDCFYHGIHSSDIAGSLTLDRVEVHHCGRSSGDHQIYVASDNYRFPGAVFRMTHCYVHDGNGGNNVKSRVGRNEIYYNWIAGAYYNELDLLGADYTAQPGTENLVREDADVVGNVFVKSAASLGTFARLGNDGVGASDGRYRFVNNTVVLPDNFATYVFRLRFPIQSVELHNNVFTKLGGGAVDFMDSTASVSGANNFIPTNSLLVAAALAGTVFGTDPLFVDAASGDFTPAAGSPLLDSSQLPTSSPVDFPFINPLAEAASLPPLRVLGNPVARQNNGAADLGALEAPSYAPGIQQPPVSATRLPGQPASFAVVAGGSRTDIFPLQFQWSHAGEPVGDATNRTLVFSAVTFADAGNYSVTVMNHFGAVTSAVVVLTVNADTIRPTLLVTNPVANLAVTDGNFLLAGTVADSARVTAVSFSLGDTNHWQPVAALDVSARTSGSWGQPLPLAPGANAVFVRAQDFSTNFSTVVGRTIFYSVPQALTVNVAGVGSVAGSVTNGQVLELTRTLTLTATPGANWVFSNWLASVDGGEATEISRTAKLVTTMRSNLVLTAQFVTNRFLAAAGSYNGLFAETNGVTLASAGSFSVRVDARQNFSGKLLLAGETVVFTGAFDLAGNGILKKPIGFRTRPLTLTLRLQLPFDGSETLTGSVSNVDGSWSAELLGDRAVFSTTANPATNWVGTHTLVLPGVPDDDAMPAGDGYATVSVAASGTVSMAGALGDGATFTKGFPIASSGRWPLHLAVNSGNGFLFGWLQLDETVAGTLTWLKLASSNEVFYPGGFTNEIRVLASHYVAPPIGTRVLSWASGSLVLAEGNLVESISNSVMVSTANGFKLGTNASPQLTLLARSGLLNGSFVHPVTTNGARTAFNGVVLQNLGEARGLFRGANATGTMRLQP